ncbi:MAG: FAD-linked oxidase C-terminal domain-containing protein, partial [Acidobacteriota bacterium]
LVERALAAGGTSTGEHGFGFGKIPWVEREPGAAVDVMRRIRAALDPDGILNPGKIFRGSADALDRA